MKSIILIGMPASGKSSIGKALAKELNYLFIDTDKMLSKKYSTKISKLFITLGEEKFRKHESSVFRQALKNDNVVISTGGGIITFPENFETIDKNKFIIIYLYRDFTKMVLNNKRPLIKSKQDIYKLYNQRKELYIKYADIIIKNSHFITTINKIISITKEVNNEKK